MAKFELEIPDHVAELVNSADRTHRDVIWYPEKTQALADIAVRSLGKWGKDIPYEELIAVTRLFNALGHCLQQTAGWDWAFVSTDEKERRVERAQRGHATRKARRAAGLPTDTELARERRKERVSPIRQLPDNVVPLFPRVRDSRP